MSLKGICRSGRVYFKWIVNFELKHQPYRKIFQTLQSYSAKPFPDLRGKIEPSRMNKISRLNVRSCGLFPRCAGERECGAR
jgi:hypothetical protein